MSLPFPTSTEDQIPGGAGASAWGPQGWALPTAFLGSALGGTILQTLEGRRAAKRKAAQQEKILAAIDTGASQAKGAIAQAAGYNQGALQQAQINRGTVNTSIAPGQAAGVAMDAGARMGAIEQERGRQRAEAISAFGAMPAAQGSPGLEGAGNALGVLLAARGNTGGSASGADAVGGSGVGQVATKASAIDQTGGDPALSGGSFRPAYSTPGAGADTPVTAMQDSLGVQQGTSQIARAAPDPTAMQTRRRYRSPGLGRVGMQTWTA